MWHLEAWGMSELTNQAGVYNAMGKGYSPTVPGGDAKRKGFPSPRQRQDRLGPSERSIGSCQEPVIVWRDCAGIP